MLTIRTNDNAVELLFICIQHTGACIPIQSHTINVCIPLIVLARVLLVHSALE